MGKEREFGIRVADRQTGRAYLLTVRASSPGEAEQVVREAGWMVGGIAYERDATPHTPTTVPPAQPRASTDATAANPPDRREIAAGVKDGCLSAVWSVVRWPLMIGVGFVVVIIALKMLGAI